MTATLFVACVIWLVGFMLAVQALSDEPHHIRSRTAILIACAFWPLALTVAIVRIIIGAVTK